MVSTRSSSRALDSSDVLTPPPSAKPSPSPAKKPAGWSHAPSVLTLAWLYISLPLVVWDTGYILLRPHTMPGGAIHSPVWTPYELYGRVDGVYGFKAWDARDGFTAAQGSLNVLETLMYMAYLYVCTRRGTLVNDSPAPRKIVSGRAGALAVLIGFSAAVMTLSKTVLYWLKEYYCGFDNIGHNPPFELIVLWIIPK